MSSDRRRLHLTFSLLVSLAMWIATTVSVAQAPVSVPKIWDDAALADWATPIAALKVRPGHYTASEYYAVSADNLRTYPVYLPDKEPPGYWESLQEEETRTARRRVENSNEERLGRGRRACVSRARQPVQPDRAIRR